MRPLRLLLDGFGTYRNPTEIDFADVEFFALVGPTGSGKSTVIDALCFALYGTVPRWGNENAIGFALAPSANTCRVCLVFEQAGERYLALRDLSRDKRGQVTTKAARFERLDAAIPADAPLAEIIEASVEQLAEGPDQVKSSVQHLLGLSYEHFTQSVLLPQGGFSEFLRATPANRQRLLVELLAFGVYKEIGQRARERAQRADNLRVAAQQARDQLADATEAAETAAATHLKALSTLADVVDESLSELAELRQQAADAGQVLHAVGNEAELLAALHMPAEVPGLAGQISAAESLVADCRIRRDHAARAAEQASQTRATLPDKAETQRQLELHARRRDLVDEAERQQADLADCAAAEEKLAAALGAADSAAIRAQGALEGAQRAHAAAGLAETLHVGAECPVCMQKVQTLPAHQAPADLTAARAAADNALQAQRQARSAHQMAAATLGAAKLALASTQARLEKAALVMAEVPGEAEVGQQLAAIEAADEAAAKARREAAARDTELAAADQSRAALAAGEQHAWAALGTARDRLVGLGAPPVGVGDRDLASAWAALVSWAEGERDKRTRRFPELSATVAGLQQQCAEAADAITKQVADHGVEAADLSRAAAAVAGQRARAEAQLQKIRAELKKVAQLDKQIDAHRQDAQVAALLGNLLRATSFERWLCSEALDSLVREASGTLMQLSGGQYELDRDDRNELVVIDYADAGTRRPVNTLSGGETFQASLALALALSRQVIGLSSGMRELNSMFLDEGFGTLDPDTLETVASTLEKLAADSDRMVGVITHVTELAERVPVRFVVSRTGTTSTLVKERA
ncbi:MAG TPA: SMC family ATPase [Streptosporangiaceae bacterium]